MKRVTFSVLFFIRKARLGRTGKTPVLLRITVNGVRRECTINLYVKPELWNAKAERSMSNKAEDYELNLRIESIRLKVMQIYREFEFDKKEITADLIMDKFLGRDEDSKKILEIFEDHNKKCASMINKGMKKATVDRYITTYKHVADFIREKYDVADLPLSGVNHEFITELELYIKTVKNCNPNTTTKYLKNFKKIIRNALANNWLKKDPFIDIRFKRVVVDRPFLTKEEIDIIFKKEFKSERLENIKNIFIFCCFTGLAFSDIKTLKTEHLIRDNKGKLWIRKARTKTQIMCNIPVLDVAQKIMDKYENHLCMLEKELILPVPSNQKMNAYLKEIADVCEIRKELSSHIARHTFATTVALANKVSIENVAKMLGHTDVKMTKHYARVLDQSILEDMEKINSIYTDF